MPMLQPMESTYQGYISSTHDALLVFECVRRGVMPKVKRRLREEERKLIRSGQVFVFDEKESGIKRWTDGLVWSPSRILWNFLVYRQVDKKFSGRPGTAQKAVEASPQTLDEAMPGSDITSQSVLTSEYDPYALGVTLPGETSLYPPAIKPASTRPGTAVSQEPPRNRSISSASDSFSNWVINDGVGGEEARPGSQLSQRAIEQRALDEEKSLVGSLKSSYPFAKGGLCKKTISIHVDGTTQHLISYYTVDDVRSGRLRTPSSLPEIASLTISPALLIKTSFRFPPTLHTGPDGIPRFRGEDGYRVDVGHTAAESSGEGNSSGSESRYTFYRSNSMMRQSHSHTGMMPMHSTGMGGRLSSTSMMEMRLAPMAHQVGGSGVYRPGLRSPVDASFKARRLAEPYPKRASLKSISDESAMATSPGSAHSAPTGSAGHLHHHHHQQQQQQQMDSMGFYPSQSYTQTSTEDLGGYNQEQIGLDAVASGMTLSVDDGMDPYKEEEDSRQRLMDELLADQVASQETDVPWQASDLQEEHKVHRVLGDVDSKDARWAPSVHGGRPMPVDRNEDGLYTIAPLSYTGPVQYASSGENWTSTAAIPHHTQQPYAYNLHHQQQQHRYNHQHSTQRPMDPVSMHEEAARRQYYQGHLGTPYPPSFIVSAPTDGVRAALSHTSLHNRPAQQTPFYAPYKDKAHAVPLTRPLTVNKAPEEGLNLQ